MTSFGSVIVFSSMCSCTVSLWSMLWGFLHLQTSKQLNNFRMSSAACSPSVELGRLGAPLLWRLTLPPFGRCSR